MDALALIAKERKEQIEKHGHTIEKDRDYPRGTLEQAAKAILSEDENEWPEDWGIEVFDHILDKPHHLKLAIAAAMLAAEIDCILAEI